MCNVTHNVSLDKTILVKNIQRLKVRAKCLTCVFNCVCERAACNFLCVFFLKKESIFVQKTRKVDALNFPVTWPSIIYIFIYTVAFFLQIAYDTI